MTEEQIARYGKLYLPVEAELGRCSMAVGEILSLRPGSLLKLHNRVGSAVTLHVGGASFGSGDMIRLGGAVAVRITSVGNGKQS